ncbi:MAG TPA: hypothetical protein VMJ90_09885, partial [Anaerolineales bacterium]|nr:hypothetical protein [Anaerolineales bacterium]
MDTKFIKTAGQKSKPAQPNLHISGIAGTVFGLFLAVGIVGAVIMDGLIDGGWIGLYVLAMSFIGTYVLFALKVASQWEKAIVLRLGKFRGLKGPGA